MNCKSEKGFALYFLAKIFIVSFSYFEDAKYVSAPQDQKNNSIRIYSGYFSRPFINILFLGDISAEYHNTIIRGIDYSKVLKENRQIAQFLLLQEFQ